MEEERGVRLFLGLSTLGLIFGTGFGVFYFAIGHRWGALIVLLCTLPLASAPWVVRAWGLAVAGNVCAFLLTAGFTGLSSMEAGVRGHAIAWLAVVPLCASILVGRRAGVIWGAICVATVGVFWVLELRGVVVPALYPTRWESIIIGGGYLSLAAFMSLLGFFYESGRRESLERLQTALGELSAANLRLQQLDAERRGFLGMAAHDLRGPLTLILGHAQLGVRQGMPPAAVERSFGQISAAGGKMRDLLDRFLGERAIEEGRLELQPELQEVDAMLSATVAAYRAEAQRKGISLAHIPTITPSWVHADRKALGQILDNLISNALKFSPPGHPIEVRSHVREGPDAVRSVHLEVADSGPGIREEDFAGLFEKFTRLSARPTAGESSTGLGLSSSSNWPRRWAGRSPAKVGPGRGRPSRWSCRVPCPRSRAWRARSPGGSSTRRDESPREPEPGAEGPVRPRRRVCPWWGPSRLAWPTRPSAGDRQHEARATSGATVLLLWPQGTFNVVRPGGTKPGAHSAQLASPG